MDFIRFYTDETGTTRFERLDPIDDKAWANYVATACNIREHPAGTNMDWHPAPRRQIVIHLTGHMEIEMRDGTSVTFGPGSARLMDDLTGSGHLTRVVGDQSVVQAVIHVDP